MGTTGTPAATAASTSREPGSEISGVPASEISAIESPAFSRATRRRLRSIENHWSMLCAIVGPTPSIASRCRFSGASLPPMPSTAYAPSVPT